jgi:hypothetical protein
VLKKPKLQHINQNEKMKKFYAIVILLSMVITQIYAQCYQCDSTTKAFTIGTTTAATGDNSFAGGYESGTSTDNSFVFGNNSIVSGLRGIALGNEVNVLQADGIAIGSNAISSAANSYVFGKDVKGTRDNSITIGVGSSSSQLLSNSKSNSIMFGVNERPSLTIVKPANADRGYLGIGTTEPEEMVHIENGDLLFKSSGPSNRSILFDINGDKWGMECINSNNAGAGINFWRGMVMETNPNWNDIDDTPPPSSVLIQSSVLFLGENGRVGVGTKSPASKLDIAGAFKAQSATITGTTSTNELSAQTATITGNTYLNGNVGIGTNDPQAKLDVNGSFKAQSAAITGVITANSAVINYQLNASRASIGQLGALSAVITEDISARNADFNGLIRTKEVNVTLDGWPDYVFEEDYDLMPLNEVKQYIKENSRLPEIPSAKEVEENGVKLGEMQKKLLLKIEELTLYILQQNEKMTDLQNQIDELKKQ